MDDIVNIFKSYRSTDANDSSESERAGVSSNDSVSSSDNNAPGSNIIELYRQHQRIRDPNKEENIASILQNVDQQAQARSSIRAPTCTAKAIDTSTIKVNLIATLKQTAVHLFRYYAENIDWRYPTVVLSLIVLMPITWYVTIDSSTLTTTRSEIVAPSAFLTHAGLLAVDIQSHLSTSLGFSAASRPEGLPLLAGILSADLPVLARAKHYQKINDNTATLLAIGKKLGLNSIIKPLRVISTDTQSQSKLLEDKILKIVYLIDLELAKTSHHTQYLYGQWLEQTLFASDLALSNSDDQLLYKLLNFGVRQFPPETHQRFESFQPDSKNLAPMSLAARLLAYRNTDQAIPRKEIRLLRQTLQRLKAGLL